MNILTYINLNRVLPVLLLACLTSCLKDKTAELSKENLVLKWNKSYQTDSFLDAFIGLNWAFSHIGAKNTIESDHIDLSDGTVQVDISSLGFSSSTQEALGTLNQKIKLSEGYINQETFDLGHYVMLLIGCSEHYYEFVGMPSNLNTLTTDYNFSSTSGYINKSGISENHRELLFTQQSGFNQLYVSQEIDSVSGEIIEFETLDLMANGQPRFGIFNAAGERINGSSPSKSIAGKPGKCMWCHESSIQPLFSSQQTEAGYLSPDQLADTLTYFRLAHKLNQSSLTEGIDFTNWSGHVQMELQYISYLEPSDMRLASEWEMSEDAVSQMLKDLPKHVNNEYPFLGELYYRNNVEPFAPFKGIEVPVDARELIGEEVNHLD